MIVQSRAMIEDDARAQAGPSFKSSQPLPMNAPVRACGLSILDEIAKNQR
jgi:hypothetical protein